MKRLSNVLYNLIDNYTGETVSFSKVTTFADGTPMTDAKCDGVIYRKLGNEYFRRNFTGPVNVKWFGAKGDGVTDDYIAIQSAIDLIKKNKNYKALYLPGGVYKINTPLNLNSKSSDNPGYFKIFGDSHSNLEGNISTSIVGNTGSGKAVIEAIGSTNLILENLAIKCDGSFQSSSTIGIFQARASNNYGFGGRHFYKNITITALTPDHNSGIGGIGIICLDGEETVFDNIEVWSALNIAHINTNLIKISNVDNNGNPDESFREFSYTPFHTDVSPISLPVSNTVFTYSGQCRLVSFYNISPNVYVSSCNDLDFGHTFFQSNNSPVGTYCRALEFESIYKIKWSGTCENLKSLFICRNVLYNADIDIIISGGDQNYAAILYFIVPGTVFRDFKNSRINILSFGSKDQKLINISTEYPVFLKVTNVFISSNLNESESSVDREFYVNSENVELVYDNGIKINISKNALKKSIKKPIGNYLNTDPAFKIMDLLLPHRVNGSSNFSALIKISGYAFTGYNQNNYNPSMMPFDAYIYINNGPNLADLVISIEIDKRNTYNSNTMGNNITDINLTYNILADKIEFFCKAVGSGVNYDECFINVDLYAKYSDTINKTPYILL